MSELITIDYFSNQRDFVKVYVSFLFIAFAIW